MYSFLIWLRPHKQRLLVLALLVIGIRFLALPVPLIYRQIVDEALPGGDRELLTWSIIILGVLLISARLLIFLRQTQGAGLRQRVLHELRVQIYAHLQKMELGFFRDQPTGGLLSRVMNDVERIQAFVSEEIFEVSAAGVQVLIVGALLLWLNSHLALLAALVLPTLMILVALFQKPLYRISRAMQQRQEQLSARIQEDLAGIRLIQALHREAEQLQRNSKSSAALRDTLIHAETIGAGVNLLTFLLTEIPLNLLVWGYGGYLVIDGGLSLGGLIAFQQYLMMLYTPVVRIFRFNIQLQMARAALDRLHEILERSPRIREPLGAAILQVERGAICFEGVSLRYPESSASVLREIDLEIQPGEILGISGNSGAGKSTLVQALLRFLDPQAGQISIDGQRIDEVSLGSLRRAVGLVAQDTFLFGDSIRDNLLLAAPEADEAALMAALEAAGALGFVQEHGLDEVLGERGQGLSGGERQRLALARVFLQDPPILIFDEATSALDPGMERQIQKALLRIAAGRTTLIIAHRASTLDLCHRQIFLEEGRLKEISCAG